MSDDLKELRECFQSDWDDWTPTREARAKDMRAMAGDPWAPGDRQKRVDAGRPVVTVDLLTQFVNQLVNEVRANPRAVHFAPGAALGQLTEDQVKAVAEFMADKMREIEYRSHAQLAYTTAFEQAVMGGMGYVRLVSEYVPGSVDQQELCVEPVVDANSILPDPYFRRPDLSDMTRCFVIEKRSIRDFRQQFPKAKVQDFDGLLTGDTTDSFSLWLDTERILLAEYWRVTQVEQKLLLVQPPAPKVQGIYGLNQPPAPRPLTIPESEWATMPAGSKVIRDRTTFVPKVTKQLVNGVEVLEETSWPGPYIPIAGCLGRVLYLDEKGATERRILSAIRLALEPYMAYCFYRTCEIENAGMTTKNPYWAYTNQVTPTQQQEIAKSLHEPVSVLFAEAVTEATGTQVLPLPQRNVSEPAIAALSAGAEEMRRATLDALGSSFLPTAAQRSNQKSGKALKELDQQRQQGTYHFVDHYEMMLRHVGVLTSVAAPHFYDSLRQTTVRKGDDTTAHVWLNNPQETDSITLDRDLSLAVTVSSGPDFDSTREAASEFADMLLDSQTLLQLLGPQKAQQIAALAVKLKVNQTGIGAIGQEIVDIISPPQDGQVNPQQVQQENQQLKAQLQEAQQMFGKMQQYIQTEQAKQQAVVEKSKVEAGRDIKLQEMKDQTARWIKWVDARIKGVEINADATAAALEIASDERIAEHEGAHDLAMTVLGQQHEATMADQQHQNSLEQGEQQQQGALAQQTNAAALQPPSDGVA